MMKLLIVLLVQECVIYIIFLNCVFLIFCWSFILEIHRWDAFPRHSVLLNNSGAGGAFFLTCPPPLPPLFLVPCSPSGRFVLQFFSLFFCAFLSSDDSQSRLMLQVFSKIILSFCHFVLFYYCNSSRLCLLFLLFSVPFLVMFIYPPGPNTAHLDPPGVNFTQLRPNNTQSHHQYNSDVFEGGFPGG